jgi:hypothetical protein
MFDSSLTATAAHSWSDSTSMDPLGSEMRNRCITTPTIDRQPRKRSVKTDRLNFTVAEPLPDVIRNLRANPQVAARALASAVCDRLRGALRRPSRQRFSRHLPTCAAQRGRVRPPPSVLSIAQSRPLTFLEICGKSAGGSFGRWRVPCVTACAAHCTTRLGSAPLGACRPARADGVQRGRRLRPAASSQAVP